MRNSAVNLFETPKGDLHIHDVIDNNVECLDALQDLYRELFPQYISALPRVRQKALLPANADPRFVRHQWVVLWNGHPAGLASFKFAIQQNVGICLSIAIRPAYRSLAWDDYRRFSHFLIRQMVKQLEVDATLSGSPAPLGLVVEIEMASSAIDLASKKSRQHLLERYREYGFLPLPVAYHEPASVRGNGDAQSLSLPVKDGQPMHLFMLPLQVGADINLSQYDMLERVIGALLVDHYGLAENHWIVQHARKSIEKLGENNDDRKD